MDLPQHLRPVAASPMKKPTWRDQNDSIKPQSRLEEYIMQKMKDKLKKSFLNINKIAPQKEKTFDRTPEQQLRYLRQNNNKLSYYLGSFAQQFSKDVDDLWERKDMSRNGYLKQDIAVELLKKL